MDDQRRSVQSGRELAQQPRLAHACLPEHRHQPPGAGCGGNANLRTQKLQVVVSPDQRR
jgi:hypothetical protein